MPDPDQYLTAAGVLLVVGVVAALGVVALAASAGPGTAEAPNVDFTAERVNESTVRVTHAGGEPVDAENVVLVVDGIAQPASWSGHLTEGDSGLVDVSSGATIQVFYLGGRGDRILLENERV